MKSSGSVDISGNSVSLGPQTTADEVLEGVDLTGKFALVTGGGGGLGFETARALMSAGADVCIGGRTLSKVEEARATLAEAMPGRRVYAFELDLSDLGNVARFSDDVRSIGRPINLFIANAGIMACPFARNSDGFELQLATNFVGHAGLLSGLSSILSDDGNARVISLSSSGHHFSDVVLDDLNFDRRAYDKWLAYGQSKTACSLLSRKAHSNLEKRGVTGLAVHPGFIGTDLMRHLAAEDYAAMKKRADIKMTGPRTYKTVPQGAATTVWAATSDTLRGRFSYLEDCRVGAMTDEATTMDGYLAYATDADNADALWHETERLLGRRLPLT